MSDNACLTFRPSRWCRITHWPRWPWQPKRVDPRARIWGTQPYLVEIRENGTTIGWHPVDSTEITTVIEVGRWTALCSLFRARKFALRLRFDPEYRSPEAIEQARRSEETLRLAYLSDADIKS